MRRLHELATQRGVRDRLVLLAGGTQITTVTDLSGIGGGNVPFKGLNIGTTQVPDPDGSDDVLVSSEIRPFGDSDAGTVNSNANALGVGHRITSYNVCYTKLLRG